MKNGKKILLFIISVLVIVLVVINLFMYQYLHSPAKQAKEQLDLGQQFLLDMEYEEAVAAFEIVIAIEPKNTEAYLGMAEAYLAMGETEKAIRILKKGYRETEDEELKKLLEELEAELNRQEADVNIVQIDTGAFPDVTVYFSLEDPEGNFIEGVQPEQIQVFEAVEQEWEEVQGSMKFSQEDNASRRSVSMLMDISGSMSGMLDPLCTAAQELLKQMQGGNYYVSLTAFDHNCYPIVDFTNNLEAVSDGLDDLYPSGGTLLYDALVYCLNQTVTQQGQKYVIAFTDGDSSGSSISEDELISLANYYHVPIYLIKQSEGYSWPQDLEEITKESGGGLYEISTIENLYDIFYEIFQFQENLYAFQYTTKQLDKECDLRVIYKSKQYDGEAEEDFISQKPIKRERVGNSMIVNVTASSSGQDYPVGYAFDSNINTMWTEGVWGNGIGEMISITLDGAHKLNGITIYNGNRISHDLYEKYSRIKTIRVTFSDGSQKQFELEDTFYEPCQVNFINPVSSKSLKIEILEVYEGTTYQDTCIAEMSIN